MATSGLATLETALRARNLDRTLTRGLRGPDHVGAETSVAELDAYLRGGLPRGHVSEIVGAPSSGRTALCLRILAEATRRGEIAALVDAADRLDVSSLVAAGADCQRVLWIRGDSPTSLPSAVDRTIDRALKAVNLVLQAGGFGIVVLDLADVSASALKRIPYSTWFRLQRAIEGSETACLLVSSVPLARSAGGMTLTLGGQSVWVGTHPRNRRLDGVSSSVRAVSTRRQPDGTIAVRSSTRAFV